jgi:hypothetical protein
VIPLAMRCFAALKRFTGSTAIAFKSRA